MDPQRRAELERVLVGGPEPVTVVVVAHDPAWPLRYAALERAWRAALGDRVLALDHIGSTAVPGLPAKPIIDAQLVVADPSDEDAYVAALDLPVRVREDGHRMLRSPERDLHLHVYGPGHPELDAHLRLRDLLRRDAGARERYARVKRALARRQWEDMNDYADAKSAVIAELLADA